MLYLKQKKQLHYHSKRIFTSQTIFFLIILFTFFQVNLSVGTTPITSDYAPYIQTGYSNVVLAGFSSNTAYVSITYDVPFFNPKSNTNYQLGLVNSKIQMSFTQTLFQLYSSYTAKNIPSFTLQIGNSNSSRLSLWQIDFIVIQTQISQTIFIQAFQFNGISKSISNSVKIDEYINFSNNLPDRDYTSDPLDGQVFLRGFTVRATSASNIWAQSFSILQMNRTCFRFQVKTYPAWTPFYTQYLSFTILFYWNYQIQFMGEILLTHQYQWTDPSSYTTQNLNYVNNSINILSGNTLKGIRQFAIQNTLNIVLTIANSHDISIALSNIQYAGTPIFVFTLIGGCSIPPNLYYAPSTNLCYDDCVSNGFYQYKSTCQACNSPCQTCSNNSLDGSSCQTCATSFFLIDGECNSSCPIGYFGNQFTNECQTCQSPCLTCYNSSINCTSCITNYFLFLQTNQCLSICPQYFYGDSTLNICQSCPLGCKTCNVTDCFSCVEQFYLSSANGIEQCLPNCSFSSLAYCNSCHVVNGSIQCLNQFQCPQTFQIRMSNFSFESYYCYCPYNLSSNLCIQNVIGCLNAYFDGTKWICLNCNNSLNLVYDPRYRNCTCLKGYQMSISNICKQKCGDRISYFEQCDDGNRIDGDGCSYYCTIQTGYECDKKYLSNYGYNSISTCYFSELLTINLVSQTKISSSNTVQLIFQFVPAPSSLNSFDFWANLNFKLNNQSISSKQLKFSYSPEGYLTILFNYDNYGDVQGELVNLSFDLKGISKVSSKFETNFILKSNDVPFLYDQSWDVYTIMSQCIFIISLLIIVLAILSTYKHKMHGAQILIIFQLIFASLNIKHQKVQSLQTFSNLYPVMGYHIVYPSLFQASTNPYYIYGYQNSFLKNINVMLILPIVFGFIMMIIKGKFICFQQERRRMKIDRNDFIQRFPDFIYYQELMMTVLCKFYYPFTIFSIIPICFGILAGSQGNFSLNYSLTIDTIGCNISYFSFFLILIFFMLFGLKGQKYLYNLKKIYNKRFYLKEQKIFFYKPEYSCYLIIFTFIQSIVCLFLSDFKYAFQVYAFINFFYFCFILIKRPYQKIFDNICLIFYNFILIYQSTIYLILTKAQLLQNKKLVLNLCIIQVVLLLLVAIFGLARFIWTFTKYYDFKKSIFHKQDRQNKVLTKEERQKIHSKFIDTEQERINLQNKLMKTHMNYNQNYFDMIIEASKVNNKQESINGIFDTYSKQTIFNKTINKEQKIQENSKDKNSKLKELSQLKKRLRKNFNEVVAQQK